MPRKRLKKPVTVRPWARTVTGFDPSGSRRATVGSGLKGHRMTCPPTSEDKTRAPGVPACVGFVCRMRKTHDAAGRPSKRSAGTTRRRQGWMPEGTRLAARGLTRSATARPAAQGDAYRRIERSAGFSDELRWRTSSVCVLDAPQPYLLVTQTECCALREMANLVVRDLHDALVHS